MKTKTLPKRIHMGVEDLFAYSKNPGNFNLCDVGIAIDESWTARNNRPCERTSPFIK